MARLGIFLVFSETKARVTDKGRRAAGCGRWRGASQVAVTGWSYIALSGGLERCFGPMLVVL